MDGQRKIQLTCFETFMEVLKRWEGSGMSFTIARRTVLISADREPTQELMLLDCTQPVQYIRNMRDGSTAGYKYFTFDNLKRISARIRGETGGVMEVRTSLSGEVIGKFQSE